MAGGAVFSVGSRGWIGALSHDRDRKAASRLAANALRAFIELHEADSGAAIASPFTPALIPEEA